jgi:hypothetical protein
MKCGCCVLCVVSHCRDDVCERGDSSENNNMALITKHAFDNECTRLSSAEVLSAKQCPS